MRIDAAARGRAVRPRDLPRAFDHRGRPAHRGAVPLAGDPHGLVDPRARIGDAPVPAAHDQRGRASIARRWRPPTRSGSAVAASESSLGQDGRVLGPRIGHRAAGPGHGGGGHRGPGQRARRDDRRRRAHVASAWPEAPRGSGRSRTPALGLSGHVRHRGLRRARRSPSDRHRRSPPARVSRVRLGGRRRAQRRPRRRQACRQARRRSKPRSRTRAASRVRSGWATRGGRPTARRPTATPTRTRTAPAGSP